MDTIVGAVNGEPDQMTLDAIGVIRAAMRVLFREARVNRTFYSSSGLNIVPVLRGSETQNELECDAGDDTAVLVATAQKRNEKEDELITPTTPLAISTSAK